MNMTFDGQAAVDYLHTAIDNNEELTDLFNKASLSVATAFSQAGEVVSGAVGIACANCWGDGSSDYFKNSVLAETDKFLLEKVQPIVEKADSFHTSTASVYDKKAVDLKE